MTERFAIYLSDQLIQIGTATEEDRPFLIYGLFCLMSNTIQIILLLIVALLSNNVVQVTMFTVCFGILKRTIGGWHASSHHCCLTVFTTLAILCTQAGQRLPHHLVLPFTSMLAVIMWILVWKVAPVEHPNNPQSPQRLTELKKISRWIASIESIVIVILAVMLQDSIWARSLLVAAMGAFCAAFALIVPNKMTSVTSSQKGE